MTDINKKVNFIQGDTSAVLAVEKLREGFENADAFAQRFGDTVTKSYDKAFEKAKQFRDAEAQALANVEKTRAQAAIDGTKASLKEAEKAVKAYERAVKDAEKAEEQLLSQAEKLLSTKEKSAVEASKESTFSRDNIGDVSTSLGSFASVAGSLGGGAGQEALAFGGDVFGVLEYIPNLKDAIKGLGVQIQSSSGVVGKFGDVIKKIAPNASDAQIGMAGLGVATVGLGAVSIIASTAMQAFSDNIDKVRESARKEIELREEGARAQVEAQQLIRDGDLKGLEERRKSTADEIERIKASNAETVAEGNRLIEQFNQIDFWGRIGFSLNGAQAEIEEYAKANKANNEEIQKLTVVLDAYDAELASNEAQLLRQSQSTDELSKSSEDAEKSLDLMQSKFESITDSISDSIERFNQSQADKAFDDALSKSRDLQDRMIDSIRASQDLALELANKEADYQQKRVDIETAGNDRIEDLRQQAIDKAIETAKRIEDINAQYQAQRIEAETKFALDNARRLEDFQRAEKRAREDFGRSQLDAILNNDALSFIRNQRDFNVSSRRRGEDFDVESNRRNEDFANSQADAERKRAEQIKNLEKELEAFNTFTQLKIESEQKAIEQRLQAEEDAYETMLETDAKARETKSKRDEEDAILRRKRAEEDDAIAQARELRALQQQLENIDIKTAAEVGALNQVLFAIDRVREASNLIMPNVPRIQSGGGIQLPNTSSIPAPTFNLQVGEIVTPSQVNPLIEAIKSIFDGLEGAVRAS